MPYTRILLIDDDEDDQETFLAALRIASYNTACTSYASAEKAFDELKKKEISPDLIFLDLTLPAMDGREFLQALKAHDLLKHIPVIVLSNTTDPAAASELMKLGAMGFLTKPNRFSEYTNLLHSILA